MSVLVLGGGITGLAAAYELGKAGIPTILLEASSRLGGKVATHRRDGFVIDDGPDSFVAYKPAAVELCRELGIGDELISPQEPRTVYVRAGGRFARLPDGMGLVLPTRLRPFVVTDLFTLRQKARMALDVLLPRELATDDVAVGAFLERRLGRAVVDRLAGPLIGGVYGTAIDQLSLDAVVPQLRDAERRHRSLLLASLADGRARRRSDRKPGSPFVALRGGIGQLTETLAEAVLAMPSVEVRLSTPVVSLATSAHGVEVSLDGSPGLRGDGAIVATPAGVAASLLENDAPAAAAPIRAIPHGSTAVVTLAYPPEHVPANLDGHGFLVADGEPLTIHACTLSSRKWADRAPEGWLLARAFVGDGAAAASWTDAELVAAAARDLGATLGLRGTPAFTRVARYRGAMPHYTVGHLDRVAAATTALAESPQVVLAGGAYRGVGLPDCIAQGRAAAGHLVQRLGGGTVNADARVADTLVGDAEVDVAGDHVPSSQLHVGELPLDELPIGTPARVSAIAPAHAEELAAEGIGPGSEVVLVARAPLGGPVVVRTGRARVAVPGEVSAGVTVRPTSEPGP
ncbi:MAG TPA: protoporphyrinogen oxidase [Candidatus Limnocylindrales bacterium]|nr:protoporphyrinogen oxidase [Candidatus Limnocylindrales bacterium]